MLFKTTDFFLSLQTANLLSACVSVSFFALTARELRAMFGVYILPVHYSSWQVFWIQISPLLRIIYFFHISLWPCLVHFLNSLCLYLLCKHLKSFWELSRAQIVHILVWSNMEGRQEPGLAEDRHTFKTITLVTHRVALGKLSLLSESPFPAQFKREWTSRPG